jgi:hypothetical protein
MIWKGSGRKRSWTILRYCPDIYLVIRWKPWKLAVSVAGLQTKVSTQELQNMKQERYPFDKDTRYWAITTANLLFDHAILKYIVIQ